MKTELIRVTVRCENTGKLIDVDYEELNFVGFEFAEGGGIDVDFLCQLCGKRHVVAVTEWD